MFPNIIIFTVNEIAKIVICDKSLKTSFFFLVHVLSSKIKLLSPICEEVVDHIFECEKISISAYVDKVQQVFAPDSISLTVLFCSKKCHEALCHGASMDCTL